MSDRPTNAPPADPHPSLSTDRSAEDPLAVLCVEEGSSLREALADEQFVVETASGVEDALDAVDGVGDTLDAVDCVVSAHRIEGGTGLDLFEALRCRGDATPCVLSPTEDSRDVEAVLALDWTDYLRRDDSGSLSRSLAHRIRSLVRSRRRATLARRLLAAVDSVSDGVAVVAPGGGFQFVNGAFARRFGYQPAELLGRPWVELYTDETVERFESTIRPALADAWRWSGSCTGRTRSDDVVSQRTFVVGLEDGSFVFVHPSGSA